MGTELVVGMLVIAVTAMMVVSPPAVAEGSSTPSNTTTSTTSTTPLVADSVALATTCVVTGATLQLGSSGADVTCLQESLIDRGLLATAVAGIFDAPTDSAVRAFQTASGLVSDGIVGQVTGTALGIWPVT